MAEGSDAGSREHGTMRPVRITAEWLAPGDRTPSRTAVECEKAVIVTEEVTGAARSERDPSAFREKRRGGVGLAGFSDPGQALDMVLAAAAAILRRMSRESGTLEANLETARGKLSGMAMAGMEAGADAQGGAAEGAAEQADEPSDGPEAA